MLMRTEIKYLGVILDTRSHVDKITAKFWTCRSMVGGIQTKVESLVVNQGCDTHCALCIVDLVA